MKPLPNSTCPVCGGPNACAPARTGDFAASCWCAAVTPDPAALAALPAELVDTACLCRRCLGDAAFVRQRLAARNVK